MSEIKNHKICVVGLGYVGLPLAIALAKHYEVIGYDINNIRIDELQKNHDRTDEVSQEALKNTTMQFTSDTNKIKNYDVYIVTVPTPVGENNRPDLKPLKAASKTVGSVINNNAVVVFESTVYPGVTEHVCAPILEEVSGLKSGYEFFLGYSPERINPGDKEHTIESITKVVSGQNSDIANLLAKIYGSINNNNIFIAKNIKTAEAAKVIENAQRDINIAFINEVASIFNKMGISVYDVLDAAATKWNFLKFTPGLVGGHCIGVDPYYLAHAARQSGYEPAVILSGRRINENMSVIIAAAINEKLQQTIAHDNNNSLHKKAKILILGLTFKENIPDLRNTKVIDVIENLKLEGYEVDVHDPHADKEEAKRYYDIDIITTFDDIKDSYACIIGCVAHREYLKFNTNDITKLLKPTGLVADIKNIWRNVKLPKGISYWSL